MLSKFKITQKLVDNLIRGFLILMGGFLISSCEDGKCQNVSGVWSIKEIQVNKKDFLPYLYINTFGFHCKNKSAWFHASYLFEEDKKAKWNIVENEKGVDSISIHSKIKIYNDNFKIEVKKLDAQRIRMILTSKSVYILAYKIVNDY